MTGTLHNTATRSGHTAPAVRPFIPDGVIVRSLGLLIIVA